MRQLGRSAARRPVLGVVPSFQVVGEAVGDGARGNFDAVPIAADVPQRVAFEVAPVRIAPAGLRGCDAAAVVGNVRQQLQRTSSRRAADGIVAEPRRDGVFRRLTGAGRLRQGRRRCGGCRWGGRERGHQLPLAGLELDPRLCDELLLELRSLLLFRERQELAIGGGGFIVPAELPPHLRDVEEQARIGALLIRSAITGKRALEISAHGAGVRRRDLRVEELVGRGGALPLLATADGGQDDGHAELEVAVIGKHRPGDARHVPLEREAHFMRPGRGPNLQRGRADQLLIEEDLRACGVRRDRDERRLLRDRFLQGNPDREALAGVHRHLLGDRLVSVGRHLELMLAGLDLGGQRRFADFLSVDAHRRGRFGFDVEARRSGTLQRERQVRVAVGIDLHRPLFLDESGPGDRHLVNAGPRLGGPGRHPHPGAVDAHGGAGGHRAHGQPRAAAIGEGKIEADGKIAVLRHLEVGAHLAPAFVLQHELVTPRRHRRDQRRAAALLAIDENDRPHRIRLDGQRGRLGKRHERERHGGVAPLAREDLPLLLQVTLQLDGHGVLSGLQSAVIRRPSNHCAVEQHVRVGRVALYGESRGATGLARQVHRQIHPPAFHVDLLLRAAAVRTGDRDRVASGQQADGERTGSGVLVVDADCGARLRRSDRHLDRLGRRVEGGASDRLSRRADAAGRAFVVLRLDEVLERPFGQHARGEPRLETAARSTVPHRERLVAGVPRLAREHERGKKPRRILHAGADHHRLSARRLLQRRVRDLADTPGGGGGLGRR